jgi:hypothetical protein
MTYPHTPDMLAYKERLVLCDTEGLTDWAAWFREHLAHALASRRHVLEQENKRRETGIVEWEDE